ncbi:unnamed protein product, partial [Staurois parvus]
HIQSSVLTVKHKHTQHTVNPLIVPHVNPFLPSAISTVSVFFFLALIPVLLSLGMSVTPSQFLPVSECLPQSGYKLLIAITINKPSMYTAICKYYSFNVNQLI